MELSSLLTLINSSTVNIGSVVVLNPDCLDYGQIGFNTNTSVIVDSPADFTENLLDSGELDSSSGKLYVLKGFDSYSTKQQSVISSIIDGLDRLSLILLARDTRYVSERIISRSILAHAPRLALEDFKKMYHHRVSDYKDLEYLYRVVKVVGKTSGNLTDIRRTCFNIFKNMSYGTGFIDSYCMGGIYIEEFVYANDFNLIVSLIRSFIFDKLLLNSALPPIYNTDCFEELSNLNFHPKKLMKLVRYFNNNTDINKMPCSNYIWLRGAFVDQLDD